MTGPDFTRWNRPGLPRIRYVDANAATHLEALRSEFEVRFPEWTRLPGGAEPGETALMRIERLERTYRLPRQDWAFETSRSFARALHILTEYIDAYANEGFLATVTQWEHVRRLAAMVGYAPKPASSAETRLVFLASARTDLARGFQVKHLPADGGAPVIFETLENLALDERLNAVRVMGFDHNPLRFNDVFAKLARSPWVAPEGAALAKGEAAVLRDRTAGTAEAVTISDYDAATRRFSITPVDAASKAAEILRVGDALLQTYGPKQLTPLLHGEGVVWLGAGHGFSKGDVAAWDDGAGGTRFAKVVEASAQAVRFEDVGAASLPQQNAGLVRAAVLSRDQFAASDQTWRMAKGLEQSETSRFAAAKELGFTSGKAIKGNFEKAKFKFIDGEKDIEAITLKAEASTSAVWFTDFAKEADKKIVASAPAAGTLLFEGKSPDLASGDWVLMASANAVHAVAVKDIKHGSGTFTMNTSAIAGGPRVHAVSHALAHAIRPLGHDRDPRVLTSPMLAVGGSARLLAPGRKLVLEDEADRVPAIIASVIKAAPDTGEITIAADPKALARFTTGGLVIRANAVDAGHGEGKPLKVLGSGSAEANGQEFPVAFTDVSTERDSSQPNGQRAAITITVDGQTYHQVESFRDCAPDEPAYEARVAETGELTLVFGDGRNGRRLPSGADNVLARIRRGSGLAGNLPPLALDKIVAPHPAVAAVRQPVAASGGDTREELAQIAANAPARLTAMDRAISVKDYERLSARFGGVWHAAAFERQSLARFRQSVRVVLVPSGGGPLGSLGEDVERHLAANGLPQTDVTVEGYEALPLQLAATLRINSSQFDPQAVAAAARAAVLARLHLRQRRPGQPLYLSEILQALEGVPGVVNSDAVLFPNGPAGWKDANRSRAGVLWSVVPEDHQVIHAADARLIAITTGEANI